MKSKKNIALKIGAIFSIVSLLLTATFFVPMFSIFPAYFLEMFITDAFSLSHKTGGIATTLIFGILFLIILFFAMRIAKTRAERGEELTKKEIIIVMLITFFIVHPLGYYVLLWTGNFPVDALNSIMSLFSFPVTSLSFVVIGFLMDRYWKKRSDSINS